MHVRERESKQYIIYSSTVYFACWGWGGRLGKRGRCREIYSGGNRAYLVYLPASESASAERSRHSPAETACTAQQDFQL